MIREGDDWARGARRSGPRGSGFGVGTSSGAGAVGARNRAGRGGVVARDRHGDLFVGSRGHVYRRDGDGSWKRRGGREWKDVDWAKPGADRVTDARPRKQEFERMSTSRNRGKARANAYRSRHGSIGGARGGRPARRGGRR